MEKNGEEQNNNESVLALDRTADWNAQEYYDEYGKRKRDYDNDSLTRLVETAPGRLWHGYLLGLRHQGPSQ